jgi:hypothetical protein
MTSLKIMSKFKGTNNKLTSHMTVPLIVTLEHKKKVSGSASHQLFICLKQYIIPDLVPPSPTPIHCLKPSGYNMYSQNSEFFPDTVFMHSTECLQRTVTVYFLMESVRSKLSLYTMHRNFHLHWVYTLKFLHTCILYILLLQNNTIHTCKRQL